ncbi:MAG: hypothetical protein ACOCQD_00040 [archaeon]
MSNYISEPIARKIQLGHNIYLQETDEYFKVTGRKNFITKISKSLNSEETDSSVDINALSSSQSQIYWVEDFYLKKDTKFWLNLEGDNLLGTTTSTYVTLDEANEITPYNLDCWFYSVTPQYDIEEYLGQSISQEIVFEGVKFNLSKIKNSDEIKRIQNSEEKCWYIDA